MKRFWYFFVVVVGIAFIEITPLPIYAEESPCIECHIKLKESAKNIHAAMKTGCETCHRKDAGKNHPGENKSIVLTENMPKLCYNCHDESKLKGEVVHAPFGSGMCTSCHDPHQSNNDKILREPSPEVCYTCHDKAKFTKKYIHNVINVVGCVTCHNPHAASFPALLPSPVNDVCITCHKSQSAGRHVTAIPGKKIHPIKGIKDPSTLRWIMAPDPLKGNRQIRVPDPNVPGKELTCASCHDPHSSDYRRLFTAQRICLKCHEY